MSHYLLPAPPLGEDGELLGFHQVMANIAYGSLGECVACKGTTWTWWARNPPDRYVPVCRHRCVGRLIDLWATAIKDGDTGHEEAPPVVVAGRRGAYARRAVASTVRQSAPTVVSVSARRAIALPQGFTPGPFWKPGYTHLEPWVVLVQAACGKVFTPFGENRSSAETLLRNQRLRPQVFHGIAVVGAALLAPDGTMVDSWGQPPQAGVDRWDPITRIPEWRRCSGCGEARWPGVWLTVHGGRCRSCVEPSETADPRPWPDDPVFPGLRTAPVWLGGPKPPKRSVKRSSEGS